VVVITRREKNGTYDFVSGGGKLEGGQSVGITKDGTSFDELGEKKGKK